MDNPDFELELAPEKRLELLVTLQAGLLATGRFTDEEGRSIKYDNGLDRPTTPICMLAAQSLLNATIDLVEKWERGIEVCG